MLLSLCPKCWTHLVLRLSPCSEALPAVHQGTGQQDMDFTCRAVGFATRQDSRGTLEDLRGAFLCLFKLPNCVKSFITSQEVWAALNVIMVTDKSQKLQQTGIVGYLAYTASVRPSSY